MAVGGWVCAAQGMGPPVESVMALVRGYGRAGDLRNVLVAIRRCVAAAAAAQQCKLLGLTLLHSSMCQRQWTPTVGPPVGLSEARWRMVGRCTQAFTQARARTRTHTHTNTHTHTHVSRQQLFLN